MGRLTEEQIDTLIGIKTKKLMQKVGMSVAASELEAAWAKLFNSRTFTCLQDKQSYFCIKSDQELLYLLDKEYSGDWKAWEFQAF